MIRWRLYWRISSGLSAGSSAVSGGAPPRGLAAAVPPAIDGVMVNGSPGAASGAAGAVGRPRLREAFAVVAQPPAPGSVHPAAAHRNDQVREPGPGMLAVELAGLGGMVRVRMVIADHREAGGPRLLVRGEHGLGTHHEAVVPAVAALVGSPYDAVPA